MQNKTLATTSGTLTMTSGSLTIVSGSVTMTVRPEIMTASTLTITSGSLTIVCKTLAMTSGSLAIVSKTLAIAPASLEIENKTLEIVPHWNFGDGSPTGVGQTITHTFSTGGLHHICLTVCCDDPITQTTYVQTYCYDIIIQLCCDMDADFYWTGTFPTFDFVGVDLGDPSACWTWNFGDGNFGTGQTISHTYAAPGTYTVCLLVCCYDYVLQVGYQNTYCKDITVVAQCPEPCEVYAGFDHTIQSITAANTTLQFNDASSVGAYTTGAVSYFWTFGDGGVSAAANPTHVYLIPGVHNVCLTITSTTAAGLTCTDTHCYDVRAQCLGDLNNSGNVNVTDILLLLGNMGGCP